MKFYFSPLDVNCKEIRGGVREGQPFRLRLFCVPDQFSSEQSEEPAFVEWAKNCAENRSECIFPEDDAYFAVGKDGEAKTYFPMQKTEYGWCAEAEFSEKGLYFYSFYIENHGYFVHDDRRNGKLSSRDENNFLLTVSTAEYKTPDWIKGGTMYQIFPDRFCKKGDIPVPKGRILRSDWGGMPSFRPNEHGKVLNNDFFGGNLQGIRSKLPYLESLGVSVLYLNPIFEASSNHRYDTSDYMKIDPLLGTEEDLRKLIAEAKSRGIQLILDGVFNHTGDDSLYFNKYGKYPSVGAFQSEQSPYFSWYNFKNYPNEYESWWGIDILPEINENSEEYQEFIFGDYEKERESGVLKKWLSFGISGYRLDVADELPDFFLKKLRDSVKESNENAVIIGEVWEDASDKIAYSVRRQYLHGEELDSVMNYPFKDAIVGYLNDRDSKRLAEAVANIVDHYPKATLDCLMNMLGTHDTARILTVLAQKKAYSKEEMATDSVLLTEEEKREAIRKLQIAALLSYTLPGVPCTYYGDEIGMEGFGDPFCRKCFDESHANAKLLEFYQEIGRIRKEYVDVFAEGAYEEVFERDGCVVFKRVGKKRNVYTCVNLSSVSYSFELPQDKSAKILLKFKKERDFPDYGTNNVDAFVRTFSLFEGEYCLFSVDTI